MTTEQTEQAADRPSDEMFRAAARELAVDGDLELDDNATVSVSEDGGAYVQMWKWIDDDDARSTDS